MYLPDKFEHTKIRFPTVDHIGNDSESSSLPVKEFFMESWTLLQCLNMTVPSEASDIAFPGHGADTTCRYSHYHKYQIDATLYTQIY